MSRLYGRKARVLVGPEDEEGREWSELKINFNVKKTRKKKPNKTQIQLTNLSEDSRSFVEQPDSLVLLYAGYGDNPPLLFYGNVSDVSHKDTKTDIVTTIEAGDGEKAYQLGRINRTYGPGTSNHEVIKDVVQEFGISIGHISKVPEIIFNQGYVAFGMLRDVLDELVGSIDGEWSIQDNGVQIVNNLAGTNDAALVVNPKSGLLGSPQKVKARGKKSKRSNGVKFSMLMTPWLRPKRYVQLQSRFHNGFYLVESVTHVGDNRTGPFRSDVEATLVEPASGGQTKKVQAEDTLLVKPAVASAVTWIKQQNG